MEVSSNGRTVLWLGTGLAVIGFIFSNIILIVAAGTLLLYLILEGFAFHRTVALASNAITIESRPVDIETIVGRPFAESKTLTNASRCAFRISQLRRVLPPQLGEETDWSPKILPAQTKITVETILQATSPGRYEVSESLVLVEGRNRFFRHTAIVPNKLFVTARPVVGKTGPLIDASELYDLSVDQYRRGPGTDLAGIRPMQLMEDARNIDWKATARTGTVMMRESYVDRDPSIILMIDISPAMLAPDGWPETSVFLSEVGSLLETFRYTTPVGLVLYDEGKVVARVDAAPGPYTRQRTMHTLLEKTSYLASNQSVPKQEIEVYSTLGRKARTLKKLTSFSASDGRKLYSERLISFARNVVPFYGYAEAKYFQRLRKEGVFAAFEILFSLPESVLAVVVSNGKMNINGLYEGARKAAVRHRIVLVIPTSNRTLPDEKSRNLEKVGIQVAAWRQGELLTRVVASQIIQINPGRRLAAVP